MHQTVGGGAQRLTHELNLQKYFIDTRGAMQFVKTSMTFLGQHTLSGNTL